MCPYFYLHIAVIPVKNAVNVVLWSKKIFLGISSTSLLPDKELEKPVTSSTPLSTLVKTEGTGERDMPKPQQVECVHIEKKKKCGCCSLQ